MPWWGCAERCPYRRYCVHAPQVAPTRALVIPIEQKPLRAGATIRYPGGDYVMLVVPSSVVVWSTALIAGDTALITMSPP